MTQKIVSNDSSSATAIMTFMQSFALSVALVQILVLPLQEDAVQMAHFDPTEIIAIPLRKDMLVKFMLVSIGCFAALQITLFHIIRSKPKQPATIPVLCQVALLTTFSTIITVFLVILCGVSPTKHIIPTLLGCFYVSTIAFAPLFYGLIYWSMDTRKRPRPGIHRFQDIGFLLLESLAQYFCLEIHDENDCDKHDPPPNICFENCEMQSDLNIIIPTIFGSFIGMSLCSILTILDWGSQLQRWPLPMLLGATGGHLCGTIWSVCSLLQRTRNPNSTLSYSTLHNSTPSTDHKVK